MSFLTDRKRAVGMGSAKSGVHHFWAMKMSSVALLILVPLFVFTVGPAIGKTHAEVLEYFARPFPAIVAALTIIVGFKHFRDGAQVLIEDYVHGTAQKITIILLTCLSYGAMATGLFAIAKIAL
ncbi:succinate dehydrogenase, hydrophobic membrane anchor protein [Roseovarius sp. CAU 1744]|uniref:succinate dehydrogenase, hydrophobic membrane anchor protein n=1 Tax=Roseovarius sp. CAU 1744 TaxID=3140368 RepID=UPI00325AE8E2